MPLLSHPCPLRAGFIDPCLPMPARVPPSGAGWLHEIKHDGYRLMARLESSGTRLFSRRGHDWTERFPRIRAALAVLRARSATMDGEAVVFCPKTGLSLFDRLHSGRHDREVVLYAFDLLELNGADLRSLGLEERKAKLAALIERLSGGIALSEYIEADGATMFRHACKLGCEGIVSKRRDAPYRSGRVRTWIKVKNPASPAMAWER
jgi:ATP-dependent DNA ligase